MNRRALTGALVVAVLALRVGRTEAAGLVPGPLDMGFDPQLAARAEGYDIVVHEFDAVPLGFGLEAHIADPAHRATVAAFLASGQRDFRAHTGMHPYEVIDRYDEFEDVGMFGGVEAAGDAFRYAVLRDTAGSDPALIGLSRVALERAMDGLHWQLQVTGQPGILARGIQRIAPAPGDPPIPGPVPVPVPLRDSNGQPLPAVKDNTWRADGSGQLPFLMFYDNCSTDQLTGYMYALAAVYDVVARDPSVDSMKIARLKADALAIGQRLMQRVQVAPGMTTDLVIMDADGRPTTFHNLAAEELVPGFVMRAPTNGFNAWLALSIMRTVYEITGDETIGRYYYEELVTRRGYANAARASLGALVYTGTETNHSDVNMAFVGAYALLRFESDPTLAASYRGVLETVLYSPTTPRSAHDAAQSFFDFVYAGFRAGGSSDTDSRAARDRGMATLNGFPAVPYWDRAVANCDDTEIAARRCTLTDGVTMVDLEGTGGHNGVLVAVQTVPMALRPPSNFEWRSDPHRVNGTGSDLLEPGWDFHGAYWLGRYLQDASGALANVSSGARMQPPPLVTDAGATDAAVDAAVDAMPQRPDATVFVDEAPDRVADHGTCGCATPGNHTDGWLQGLLATLVTAIATSRSRRRGARSVNRPSTAPSR